MVLNEQSEKHRFPKKESIANCMAQTGPFKKIVVIWYNNYVL